MSGIIKKSERRVLGEHLANKLEDKELLVEDLDEAFYEKICRAYVDTANLEWVTTNPENNNSVIHGYFVDDATAKEYGFTATPENFKEIANGEDYYEYDTWEDFYEDYVKEEILYDIDDIGVYSDGTVDGDEWDFYISEEDLTKLGLWDEDSSLVEEKDISIKNYAVTFKWHNSDIACYNICQATSEEAIHTYFGSNCEIINIEELSDSDIEMAKRKGVPFIKIKV